MRPLSRLALVFGGVLAVTGLALVLGRQEPSGRPSALNVLPSGLGAFADLLRADGYVVTVDRSEKPLLGPTDLAIAPVSMEPTDDSDGPVSDKTLARLTRHFRQGGSVLELRFPPDFDEAQRTAAPVSFKSIQGRTANVSSLPLTTAISGLDTSGLGPSYADWHADGLALVGLFGSSEGRWVDVNDALGATNHFLGTADNADFYLELVRKLAKPGSKIVFAEATLGDYDAVGLLGSLGGWAVTAQWQIVLLCIVIVSTLGRRFGFAEKEATAQRSARHLLESMAEILQTSGKQSYSARIVADECIEKLRRRWGLPRGTNPMAVATSVSPAVAEAYGQILDSAQNKTSAKLVAEATDRLIQAAESARPEAQ